MKKDNLLIKKLLNKYGYNEPIFTDEILSIWCDYSRPRIFQLLKQYTDQSSIMKFDYGVYYIPTDTIIGKSKLDPQKVIEKKYIKRDNKVFGYYTGLAIQNALGLTTQVPTTLEIVTENEVTRKRQVQVGKAKVLLRCAKTQITKENAPMLQLLEVLKNIKEPLDNYAQNSVINFIKNNNIKLKDLKIYSELYPKRALNNLKYLGANYAITL